MTSTSFGALWLLRVFFGGILESATSAPQRSRHLCWGENCGLGVLGLTHDPWTWASCQNKVNEVYSLAWRVSAVVERSGGDLSGAKLNLLADTF